MLFTDKRGSTCTKCGEGKLSELTLADGINKVVKCPKCDNQITRWIPLKTKDSRLTLME